MSKQENAGITVICCRCGSIIMEGDIITSCKHIDAEEAQDFYKYINSKAKRPIYNIPPKYDKNKSIKIFPENEE